METYPKITFQASKQSHSSIDIRTAQLKPYSPVDSNFTQYRLGRQHR